MLCNDTGEQRYWDGRWRDEKAENEKLRAALRSAREDINDYGLDNFLVTTHETLAKIDAALGSHGEKEDSK